MPHGRPRGAGPARAAARGRTRGRPRRRSPDTLTLDGALGVLDAAFAGLDPEDRAILVLHELDARPAAEIAAALHVPAGTVRWRLHESLATLRASLE